MQVTKEGIERIKSVSELSAVVAERGLELKRKGRHLVGLCPWHQEKTPSFTVSPAKGLFHCFGCGKAGDVIGFVTHFDQVGFPEAVRKLAVRAGLDVDTLMQERPRVLRGAPLEALTPPPTPGNVARSRGAERPMAPLPTEVLSRVVDHYHRTFCERKDAQDYLKKRGLTDVDLLRALRVGYADGSLLKLVPRSGADRDALVSLGVITSEGRELLGGCVVVPIPDPLTGEWTSLYGRGLRTPRHCYLPGPLRGVLNFQAARLSLKVVLTESILDALSFHQAGIATAIPLYGTNGFTPDHLDLLKREGVREVTLALDNDGPGQTATAALKARLLSLGISVRLARFPDGIKDANELLVSRNGDAVELLRRILDDAQADAKPERIEPAPRPTEPARPGADPAGATAGAAPADEEPAAADAGAVSAAARSDGQLTLARGGLTYHARVHQALLGRLRVTVKVFRGTSFHADTLDLYASRSRAEFARRAAKACAAEASVIEADLLTLLVEAEKAAEAQEQSAAGSEPTPAAMSEAARAEALALLQREDLLDQVARDIDALGYVGEQALMRLLYLIAISRKLDDPCSGIVLSGSGAGKSGATEVIERLTPPEDVVLLTRLTPQSLYYTEPGFLDRKLVIVEERCGSQEADYSIRVLQSRKKLIAAAPVKDPQTGNLRTKVFTVEARAAFIEATTASAVNHENATRCFELSMDESAEQTRKIHERQRLMRTEAGLLLRQEAAATCRRHWNAQRLLEPLAVVIPFADKLSFPSSWMRTRRDHARFLNLIEVSAFLHQHQRERRGGAIVASLADYATAYGLAGEVLRDTLTDLRKPLRDAYARIRALAEQGSGVVSRREIREALTEPDSTVRRWLNDLVELEYLAVTEAGRRGQGKTTRYAVVEQAATPMRLEGLLTPEELRQRL